MSRDLPFFSSVLWCVLLLLTPISDSKFCKFLRLSRSLSRDDIFVVIREVSILKLFFPPQRISANNSTSISNYRPNIFLTVFPNYIIFNFSILIPLCYTIRFSFYVQKSTTDKKVVNSVYFYVMFRPVLLAIIR